MVNLWGPGAYGSARPSAARPALVPANGALDAEDFFKDCTSPEARDGTEWRSGLLNALIVNMRSYARKSGVPISNLDDDLMTRAGRRGFNYVVAGGTANALTAALDPAPVAGEIANGFRLYIEPAFDSTAALTLAIPGVSAGAALPVTLVTGGAALAGALRAATPALFIKVTSGWLLAQTAFLPEPDVNWNGQPNANRNYGAGISTLQVDTPTAGSSSGLATGVNSRFNVTIPGWYLLFMGVFSASGAGFLAAGLRRNSPTGYIASGSGVVGGPYTNGVASASRIIKLAAGDYVDAYVSLGGTSQIDNRVDTFFAGTLLKAA